MSGHRIKQGLTGSEGPQIAVDQINDEIGLNRYAQPILVEWIKGPLRTSCRKNTRPCSRSCSRSNSR